MFGSSVMRHDERVLTGSFSVGGQAHNTWLSQLAKAKRCWKAYTCTMCRVGQNHTFIGMHGVHTVFLAGVSPNIRSYTVQIYGSGHNPTHVGR